MKRLQATLRTHNATFTAADAFSLLNYWNVSTTSRTLLERARLKYPVDQKVRELETVEMALVDKEAELDAAMADYQQKEKALQKARADKVLALQAEKRAREALAKAQRRVAESKSRVNNETKLLSQAEVVVEKLAFERERLLNGVARQQDDVRNSMLKREERNSLNQTSGPSSSDDDDAETLDLDALKAKEEALIQEYERMEAIAKRLQDQANALKERAERIKKLQ